MSRVPRQIALGLGALLLIAAAGAAGVIGGQEFLHWKERRDKEQKLLRVDHGAATQLRAGDPFPLLALGRYEEGRVRADSLMAGRPHLVFLVSVGCDACTEAVRAASADVGELPPGVDVLAIADESPIYTRAYEMESGYAFPVYSDAEDKLTREYDVDVFPTIVGVDEHGRMSFVRHGAENFSLPAAARQLLGEGS